MLVFGIGYGASTVPERGPGYDWLLKILVISVGARITSPVCFPTKSNTLAPTSHRPSVWRSQLASTVEIWESGERGFKFQTCFYWNGSTYSDCSKRRPAFHRAPEAQHYHTEYLEHDSERDRSHSHQQLWGPMSFYWIFYYRARAQGIVASKLPQSGYQYRGPGLISSALSVNVRGG